jgi:hypothetical protein
MPDVFRVQALACPFPRLDAGRRWRARWRDGTLQGALLCRSGLARDRLASVFFGLVREPESKLLKQEQELSSRPSGAPSYFSLLAQREVTKRKGTPRRSPSGILPPGARAGSAGSRTAHPALRERAHIRVRAPAGLWLRPPADRQGAPLRGHRGRAGLVAPPSRRDQASARGAANTQRKRHCAPIPYVAPSNAAADRGKARMFEAMDGRVRAGRSAASSAMPARQSGRLLFGYFLLARQEKVTRAGRRPDRNALALASEALAMAPEDTNNRSKNQSTGRQQAGSYKGLQAAEHQRPRSNERSRK